MRQALERSFPNAADWSDAAEETLEQYVTVYLGNQLFGFPILRVQDVIGAQRLTRIPLAPPEIAGSVNVRGRIVTAIDLRRRLDLPPSPNDADRMSVIVEQAGELYGFLIDEIGDVLALSMAGFEPNPPTLDSKWRKISAGIHRLETGLMIILNVERLLDLDGDLDHHDAAVLSVV